MQVCGVAVPDPFAAALAARRPGTVCDAPTPTPESLLGRAMARLAVGREEEGRADLEAALPALGDPARVELAALDVRRGSALRRARDVAAEVAGRSAGVPALLARALHVLGLAEEKLRRNGAALDALLRASEAYGASGDLLGRARVLDTIGTLHKFRGHMDRALASYALSLVDKALLGDREGIAITLGNLGRLHLHAGRPAEALDCFSRDLAIARELGDRRGEARMHDDIGRAHVAAGDPAAAEASFRAAIALAEASGFPDIAFHAHRDLCVLHAQEGRIAAAEEELRVAEAAVAEEDDAYTAALLDAARGQVLLARGEDAAVDALERAVRAFGAAEVPDLELAARIALARAFVSGGSRLKANAERVVLEGIRKARRGGFLRHLAALNEEMERLGLVEGAVDEPRRALAQGGQTAPPGAYQVLGRLGEGAFGEVFRAYDPDRGIEVAYKRIRLSRVYDARVREHLRRSARLEIEAASRVRHPGVVRVHAVGTDEEGDLYVVQDLVRGRPLRDVLSASPRPPVDDVLETIGRVADALAALHAAGVLHRDLKPENVIVRGDGTPVLVDFGIAHLGGDDPFVGAGTPDYMAPEQAEGKRTDARADLYALGVILFEWLAGRRPHPGDRVAPRLSSVRDDVPEAVDDLVARLLEVRPRRRPASAAEVAATCASLRRAG